MSKTFEVIGERIKLMAHGTHRIEVVKFGEVVASDASEALVLGCQKWHLKMHRTWVREA